MGLAMVNECRPPEMILKELLRVQELMRKNKEFIKIYPEDYGLKLNLYSFAAREKELISEYQDSLKHYQIDGFDILIKGKYITDSSISMVSLGETLVKMQNLITELVFEEFAGKNSVEKISPAIRNVANLNVVATTSGSFGVILSNLSNRRRDKESKIENALVKFNELLDCKDDKELIRAQASKLGIRAISKYVDLLKTIYVYEENLVFYDKVKPESFDRKEISSEDARKAYAVLAKQKREVKENAEYAGTLKAVDLLEYKCKFQVDYSKTIAARFSRELVNNLKENLDMHVTAQFIITKIWNDSTSEMKSNWKLIGLTSGNTPDI